MEGECGSSVVCRQLKQQTASSAPQPHPNLHPYHPLARREGQCHFHVGGCPQASRHGGSGTIRSRPPWITLTSRASEASNTVPTESAPILMAGAGHVLRAAAGYTCITVDRLAQIHHLQYSRERLNVKSRKTTLQYTTH